MQYIDKEKELRKNCSLVYDKFLLDYRLEDIYKTNETHPRFCHYECSPIFLMESLVNSMEILPSDCKTAETGDGSLSSKI